LTSKRARSESQKLLYISAGAVSQKNNKVCGRKAGNEGVGRKGRKIHVLARHEK
jgi:hypothetical protein